MSVINNRIPEQLAGEGSSMEEILSSIRRIINSDRALQSQGGADLTESARGSRYTPEPEFESPDHHVPDTALQGGGSLRHENHNKAGESAQSDSGIERRSRLDRFSSDSRPGLSSSENRTDAMIYRRREEEASADSNPVRRVYRSGSTEDHRSAPKDVEYKGGKEVFDRESREQEERARLRVCESDVMAESREGHDNRLELQRDRESYGLREDSGQGAMSKQTSPQQSFAKLERFVQEFGSASVEQTVQEVLTPLLREWLDLHLPEMVERMVEAEIRRISARKP